MEDVLVELGLCCDEFLVLHGFNLGYKFSFLRLQLPGFTKYVAN